MRIPKVPRWVLVVIIGILFLSIGGTSISSNDGSLYIGGNANGIGTGPPVTASTTNINMSTATTTQLVALSASQQIYITHVHFIANGTTNVSLVYGTGSNCGVGTTTLDGPLPLAAQTGYAAGSGFGAVEVVPVSQALCITSSQAVNVGGAVSWSKY